MNNLIAFIFIAFGAFLMWGANRNRKKTEGPFKYHLFVKGIIGGLICILIGLSCLLGIINTAKLF